MDDLYKTTKEQRIRLYEIADSMRQHGLDSCFVDQAVEIAEYYEGAFDLFCLWAKELDEDEKSNIIAYLMREIEDTGNYKVRVDCPHSNFVTKNVVKNIVDSQLSIETLVCDSCGAFLRGKEYEEKYFRCLAETYKNNPEKFQIDCYLSDNIIQAANVYLEAFPATSIESFVKALVVIYFNVLDQGKKESILLEALFESKVSKLLANEEDKRKISIHLKPKLMIEILAIAEVLNLSPSALVEEVVIKFMTVCNSQDPKTKEFWNNEIYEYLDIILTAT